MRTVWSTRQNGDAIHIYWMMSLTCEPETEICGWKSIATRGAFSKNLIHLAKTIWTQPVQDSTKMHGPVLKCHQLQGLRPPPWLPTDGILVLDRAFLCCPGQVASKLSFFTESAARRYWLPTTNLSLRFTTQRHHSVNMYGITILVCW